MYFEFRPDNYNDILQHYNDNGFVVITGVDSRIAATLREVISRLTGLTDSQIRTAGQSDREMGLPVNVRNKLARPPVTAKVQKTLLQEFGGLLVQLLGPIMHISREFHPQIKRGSPDYILKGYSGDGLEVEAAYGLHTDFTAGRVTTSPNALALWIPLNTCEQSGLRLFRRSHAKGLVTNGWLRPNTAGLDRIGDYVDIFAEEGQALMFNFSLLHGTAIGSMGTRISADLRFFPFCGILDSSPFVLRSSPVKWIHEQLRGVEGDTLKAPLYEALAYLGQPISWPRHIHRYSPVNWARYIQAMLEKDTQTARQAIEALVNTEIGFDELSVYLERFSTLDLKNRPYNAVLDSLSLQERRHTDRILAVQEELPNPGFYTPPETGLTFGES